MMKLTPEQEITFARYGIYPYNWIVEGRLLASVYPADENYLKFLKEEEGIDLSINLTESPWPENWQELSGIRCLHFPVVDMSVPSLDDAGRIIEEIDNHDGPVMLHCAAGIGRTGTMIGLYLVHRGMDPEEAIRTVRRKRPGSIQTSSQERFIMRWTKDRR
jgi:atypical dual specificity phosphatase